MGRYQKIGRKRLICALYDFEFRILFDVRGKENGAEARRDLEHAAARVVFQCRVLIAFERRVQDFEAHAIPLPLLAGETLNRLRGMRLDYMRRRKR